MSILDFSPGDIVENKYNALRGAVVYFIAYPPELQVLLEDNRTIDVHADDWKVICRHESLALSSFNGRGPRGFRGKDAVHA